MCMVRVLGLEKRWSVAEAGVSAKYSCPFSLPLSEKAAKV